MKARSKSKLSKSKQKAMFVLSPPLSPESVCFSTEKLRSTGPLGARELYDTQMISRYPGSMKKNYWSLSIVN